MRWQGMKRCVGVITCGLSLVLMQFSMVSTPIAKNSWRGIVPLRSSASQVAQVLGRDPDTPEGELAGPFNVDGGQVSFSFLTASLAKIYRAPAPLIGKVFTVYFKPDDAVSKMDLRLTPGFRRCTEENDHLYYYLVSESGIAYQLKYSTNQVETVIYQPSRAEVRRLSVNVDCVF